MKNKTTYIWIFAVIFTLFIAVYQRMTGPTYPVRGTMELEGEEIKYRLLRSHDTSGDAFVKIKAPESVNGLFTWKRYKSHDEWSLKLMTREDDKLVASIPVQPSAGKVEYKILLQKDGGELIPVVDDVTVIRFVGVVPNYILIPHILFMFLAMLYSSRAGMAAIFKEDHTYNLAIFTTVFLFLGGIILGPIVQKFAFGAYWTGWPWGHDLTDNKTLVAFIMWLIAIWRLKKNPNQRGWALAAALVLLAVYLIPHSVLGSEIDYTQLPE